jgi:branched-chain amino acid transport system ATP-binding protein
VTALIEAKALTCGYNKMAVVHDLNLQVRPGQIVALLGPNGAGKTTTLRTLAGELPPLGGELLVNGESSEIVGECQRRRLLVSFV